MGVCAELGGPRVLRAAQSARGSGVHGEALGRAYARGSGAHGEAPKCLSTRGSGEALGLRRPRGLGSPRGGPGSVPSVRAAPGLLSALSCTSRATHGAGESWPGQEPRQARRQQPVTVSGTVVTNRNVIYPGFRFSLEWLKLESEGGHSVWQQG